MTGILAIDFWIVGLAVYVIFVIISLFFE